VPGPAPTADGPPATLRDVADAPFVHETAIVEAGAEIGTGSRIWHHTHVRTGAVVGRDCTIGKNVYLDAGVSVGAGVKIQNNVSVYSGVTIADDVFVGPSAVFTNDRQPRAFVPDWEITPTLVHRGASIGANATIVCGVEIGEYAMVGAGAVVTRTVAAHALVVGNPARPIGWVCRCGRAVQRDPQHRPVTECPACPQPVGLR